MALSISTPDPKGLLQDIRSAIDTKKIETWRYDKDGDFTHSPAQWVTKAWLRPVASLEELSLTIVRPQSGLEIDVPGVYQGRFAEMLINHFPKRFSKVSIVP